MAFRTNKTIFYHIPKTGGIWVRKALKLSVGKCVKMHGHPNQKFNLTGGHAAPLIIKNVNVDNPRVFSFAFVRNPLTWYQSFWAHRMLKKVKLQKNNSHAFPLDKLLDRDFERFIFRVLKKYPKGFVTELFQCYVGKDGKALNSVGKQENLTKDLIKVLRLAGEKFDQQIMKNLERKNTAASRKEFDGQLKISENYHRQLMNQERWVLDTFYKKK